MDKNYNPLFDEKFEEALKSFKYRNLITLTDFPKHIGPGKKAYMDISFLLNSRLPYLYEKEVLDWYLGQRFFVMEQNGFETIHRDPIKLLGNLGDIEIKLLRAAFLRRKKTDLYINDVSTGLYDPAEEIKRLNETIDTLIIRLRGMKWEIDEIKMNWSDTPHTIYFKFRDGKYTIPWPEG